MSVFVINVLRRLLVLRDCYPSFSPLHLLLCYSLQWRRQFLKSTHICDALWMEKDSFWRQQRWMAMDGGWSFRSDLVSIFNLRGREAKVTSTVCAHTKRCLVVSQKHTCELVEDVFRIFEKTNMYELGLTNSCFGHLFGRIWTYKFIFSANFGRISDQLGQFRLQKWPEYSSLAPLALVIC